jgi:aspartate/methionine/tyrosine aminotransferase
VRIPPFALERFYERWEFRAELMLSSSDCESRAVADLLALEPEAEGRLLNMRLGYTEVPGSRELREAIAGSYERVQASDVLTLAAAEEGIFLVCHGLLDRGDHAVVEAPCYGSALELARSTGAEVSVWQRHFEDAWAHDISELEGLLRPQTKLIYINSPHNPTGTHMSAEVFERVLELADEGDIVLLSDEVYRGLEHDPGARLAAACDRYARAISLGAVSKAYGLPGLRVGWLASREVELIERTKDLKLYTTICSSAPSELLVALAVRHSARLVAANRELVLSNLPVLDDLLARRAELFAWVRPTAGPIGFPRVSSDVGDVHAWCEQIATDANVLLLPGSVYGQPRHVRLGFGRANLGQAVQRLDDYLEHP